MQATAGTKAVAAICAVAVGGGLIAFIVLRFIAPKTPADANVLFAFRVGALQIFIGITGMVGSFAIPFVNTNTGWRRGGCCYNARFQVR